MAGKTSKRSAAITGMAIGVAVALLVVLVSDLLWPNAIELKLLDYRHRNFSDLAVSEQIVHIDIDDKSLELFGRWPWERRDLADLIRLCRDAGARQVVLDIILQEEQRLQFAREGITDKSRYEPVAVVTSEATDIPQIDNDELLGDEIVRSGGVMVPFYADFAEAASTPEARTDAGELYGKVMALLEEDRLLSFKQIFLCVWPDRDFGHRDNDYHRLLQSYIQCKGIESLRRFGVSPGDGDLCNHELRNFKPPLPLFAQAISATGFITVQPDSDGVVRRVPLLARYEGRLYKQLAFAAACAALGVMDEDIDLSHESKIVLSGHGIEIPLDEDGMMLIAWPGKRQRGPKHITAAFAGQIWENERAIAANTRKARAIETLQFQLASVPDDIDSLDDKMQRRIAEMREQLAMLGSADELAQANAELAERIKQCSQELSSLVSGKIVLIGPTATGVPDFVVTPMGPRTPGVEVHGHVLNTILQQGFISRAPRAIEILVALGFGLLMTTISAVLSPLASGLVVLILGIGSIWVNFAGIFGQGHTWMDAASGETAIISCFTVVTFFRQISEIRAKRQVVSRFKQYASPAVVDRIVSSAGQISTTGEMRPISCYFSDLAGFTSVSERLGPERTVSILNIYLDRMTEVLDRHFATINKFEGDGIFAFFGAPVASPDHARLACMGAIDTQRELAKLVLEQQKVDESFPSLRMRVGLSSGEAVVGDCGSQRRFDYTAIGDTVNLAARLESANKAFGTRIMISQETHNQCKDAIATRYLGCVRVVGKTQGVGVYELLGPAESMSDEQAAYAELFASAIQHYEQGQFDVATKVFEQCLCDRADDIAASLYWRTCKSYLADGPPDDFNGTIELTEK